MGSEGCNGEYAVMLRPFLTQVFDDTGYQVRRTMNSLLCSTLALFASFTVLPLVAEAGDKNQPIPVEVVQNDQGEWQILRGGEPYYVKGGCRGSGLLEELPAPACDGRAARRGAGWAARRACSACRARSSLSSPTPSAPTRARSSMVKMAVLVGP